MRGCPSITAVEPTSATRSYDPLTGRWTSKDWIDFNGGDTNTSRYVGNSPTNATDPMGTISRTQVGERKSGPGELTVNWKFQLDQTYDEPIVLIQRVEVTTKVYNAALKKYVTATTSYFEVIGTIQPGKTELDRPAGRNYDDTWSLQASEINSFGEGLAVHLSMGTMVMRGQIRAFKQSDVEDQISKWLPKRDLPRWLRQQDRLSYDIRNSPSKPSVLRAVEHKMG